MAGRLYELNLNVIAHLFDGITRFQQPVQAVGLGIEMKAVDRGLQASATKNLLRHTLKTLLQIGGNVGHNILVGHLLLLHQDQGF